MAGALDAHTYFVASYGERATSRASSLGGRLARRLRCSVHFAKLIPALGLALAARSSDVDTVGTGGGTSTSGVGPVTGSTGASGVGQGAGQSGSSQSSAGGVGGADACLGTQPTSPPAEGLYGCDILSSCHEITLHSEIQWGHSATTPTEWCGADAVATGQRAIIRWKTDSYASIAILNGEGKASIQRLSFEFTGAGDGCWTLEPPEQCDVEAPRCDEDGCRWNPDDDISACVPAEPAPTCDSVDELFGTDRPVGCDPDQLFETEVQVCTMGFCCGEATACSNDIAACFHDDGTFAPELPAGAALRTCQYLAGCIDAEVCDSGLTFENDLPEQREYAFCLDQSCCAELSACTANGADVEACSACLDAGEPYGELCEAAAACAEERC